MSYFYLISSSGGYNNGTQSEKKILMERASSMYLNMEFNVKNVFDLLVFDECLKDLYL